MLYLQDTNSKLSKLKLQAKAKAAKESKSGGKKSSTAGAATSDDTSDKVILIYIYISLYSKSPVPVINENLINEIVPMI